MNNPAALKTLLDHATAERDEATAQLYLLLEQTRRVQSQREQLVNYRDEYQARWTQQFRQSAAIEVVQSYQTFVERLQGAIAQLDRQAAQAAANCQAARALLVERETRVASVRKLIQRRTAELQRSATLREQKAADEIAALATWHARPALTAAANH
jgi:flagellar FliJ protein